MLLRAHAPERFLEDIFQRMLAALEHFAHPLFSLSSFIPQIHQRRNRIQRQLGVTVSFCAGGSGRRQRGEFILEFDDHTLGKFSAHAWNGHQANFVALLQGARQIIGRNAGQDIDRQPWTDPRNPEQQQKNLFFTRILKAKELNRVLANVSEDLQAHRSADFGQPIKNVEWNENLITHAVDVDDDFAGNLLRQCAGDLRDHVGIEIGLPETLTVGKPFR